MNKNAANAPIAEDIGWVDLSEDGSVVAWAGSASEGEVAGCVGERVFVKDMLTGTIDCADKERGGAAESSGQIYFGPSLSADARYVVFTSDQRDLVEGPCNRLGLGTSSSHAYVRDLGTGAIACVDQQGAGAGIATNDVLLSDDGRFIIFQGAGAALHPLGSDDGWGQLYKTPNPLYVAP